MAKQNESEKLVRKALKETKQYKKILFGIEMCFIVVMLMFGVACVVYSIVAIPDKPQADDANDELPEGCMTCVEKMPGECVAFFEDLPEECETCVGGIETEGYNKEYYTEWAKTIVTMLLLFVGVILFYIFANLVGSTKKDMEIKQLRLEHALELDNLKKGRK